MHISGSGWTSKSVFLYLADIMHVCDFNVSQVTSTFYTISARKQNYKFSSLEDFKVGGSLDHVQLCLGFVFIA